MPTPTNPESPAPQQTEAAGQRAVSSTDQTQSPPSRRPDNSRLEVQDNFVLRVKRLLVPLLLAAAVISLVAAGTWAGYYAEQRNDQYQLINLGRCVAEGHSLYVDCWENKPPGLAWINALGITVGSALSDDSHIGPWILPGVVLLFSLLILGWAAWRTFSLPTAWAVVLIASAVMTMRLYDSPSINPDSYSSIFALIAGAFFLVALDAGRTRRFIWTGLLAGFFWAAAATVKQTGLLGLIAVSVVALACLLFRRPDGKRWAGVASCAWLGFVIGIGAVATVLNQQGILAPAWEATSTFNRDLLTLQNVWDAMLTWNRTVSGLSAVQLPLWIAILGLVATSFGGKANRLGRSLVLALLVWWILDVAFSLAGPSRSMRYWQSTWPAMLLMAAVGIFHFEQTIRTLSRELKSVAVIAGVTIVWVLGTPLYESYRNEMAASDVAASELVTERRHYQAIGSDLAALVPEGELIYVWSYDAGMYVHSERLAASRFTYPRSADQMEEILSSLESGRAYAILHPFTRSAAFDLWCDEACEDRYVEVLERYRTRATIGRYDVYLDPVEESEESPVESAPEEPQTPEG